MQSFTRITGTSQPSFTESQVYMPTLGSFFLLLHGLSSAWIFFIGHVILLYLVLLQIPLIWNPFPSASIREDLTQSGKNKIITMMFVQIRTNQHLMVAHYFLDHLAKNLLCTVRNKSSKKSWFQPWKGVNKKLSILWDLTLKRWSSVYLFDYRVSPYICQHFII